MPRVLDQYEDHTASNAANPVSAELLWKSTDIRLEHFFRLLSLSLALEPLHVAFQALHTSDEYLRGTALEYLESILPAGIRETLLQFLDGSWPAVTNRRSAVQIAEELMRSRQQIQLKVAGGEKDTDQTINKINNYSRP